VKKENKPVSKSEKLAIWEDLQEEYPTPVFTPANERGIGSLFRPTKQRQTQNFKDKFVELRKKARLDYLTSN